MHKQIFLLPSPYIWHKQQTRGHEKSALVQLLIFTAIFICNFFFAIRWNTKSLRSFVYCPILSFRLGENFKKIFQELCKKKKISKS